MKEDVPEFNQPFETDEKKEDPRISKLTKGEAELVVGSLDLDGLNDAAELIVEERTKAGIAPEQPLSEEEVRRSGILVTLDKLPKPVKKFIMAMTASTMLATGLPLGTLGGVQAAEAGHHEISLTGMTPEQQAAYEEAYREKIKAERQRHQQDQIREARKLGERHARERARREKEMDEFARALPGALLVYGIAIIINGGRKK